MGANAPRGTLGLVSAVIVLAIGPALSAQSPRVGLHLGFGVTTPIGGSRFTTPDAGYMVEAVARVAVSESWQIGAGALWGTFGGEVPEFSVFAPLDHDPWMEYNVIFTEARRVLGPAARLRPFLGGRLGWVRELAEYSGAEIRRAGPGAGPLVGVMWRAGRLSVEMSGTVLASSLGAGSLQGLPGPAPGELSPYWDARLALGFGVR